MQSSSAKASRCPREDGDGPELICRNSVENEPEAEATVDGKPNKAKRDAAGAEANDDDNLSETSFTSSNCSALSPEECISLALSLKDEGTAFFKDGKFQEALAKYEEGEKRLKRAKDSDGMALSVQLSSNRCLCCVKLERWQEAIEAANTVLGKEPQNLKALYRRAVSFSNIGSFQKAKEDLLTILTADPANSEARKEIHRIKEKIRNAHDEDKKAYGGLFRRTTGLYQDREDEREIRKKKDEEERAKRKTEWQTEMEHRKKTGKEEQSFDDWLSCKKETKDREREQKQKDQQKRESSQPSKKIPTNATTQMDVDEEDQAIINETKKMGYCYFRRNLTDEEKKLNAENKPLKIGGGPEPERTEEGLDLAKGNVCADGRSISQWNSKGTTYEEKDVSVWARARFAERLQEVSVSCGAQKNSKQNVASEIMKSLLEMQNHDTHEALKEMIKTLASLKFKVTKVEDVSGDVHLAVVRGTRRVFFELKCRVVFSVNTRYIVPIPANLTTENVFGDWETKGSMLLPEVNSADGTGMSWLDGNVVSFDSPPPGAVKTLAYETAESFKKAIAEKIQAFLDDCKALA